MKRAKYKAKNIHAFKRIFECEHPECKDYAIVTYREEPDTEDQVPVTRRRCIIHTHWHKEPPQVKAAKSINTYRELTDVAKWLSLAHLHTGQC